MKTPICDYVKQYCETNAVRLHMPGHKGISKLGPEPCDITEIDGADSLYEASGIIAESECNATSLFESAATFYSTEGSSQCIRAMLYLAKQFDLHQERKQYAGSQSDHVKTLIMAYRNAHKTFLSAAALLDIEIVWAPESNQFSYLSCEPDLILLEKQIKELKPAALYLTSPDYLGRLAPIKELADICKRYGVLLLVDHAHGAYLKYLSKSQHPIDLGADLCCDSAHKTLPVLTGGAYLHVSKSTSIFFKEQAKSALALFGSTSPSYLILQSLDLANAYLAGEYRKDLSVLVEKLHQLKSELGEAGFLLKEQEPLKITISTKPYGYRGTEFAKLLKEQGIVCEFADPDYLVMMFSTQNKELDFCRLKESMLSIKRKPEIKEEPIAVHPCERIMSVREALFSLSENIPACESRGRILADLNVSCPPAVPIVMCGERISEEAVRAFHYYHVKSCNVVKEKISESKRQG
ncbi:MAG: aminotransferase class I/II-fold pyridoxal phosphate-dependent enzyme [Clostridia bacterium]|nr:aminotransferase class I/II-fold pyridoxal phosphate-dependent enzyme [Clostridia bacterium]